MLNFNTVHTMFQAQLARATSFFEGQRRSITDSTEAQEKNRLRADEFKSSHPLLELEEVATDNDMHTDVRQKPFNIFNKDGWR